MELLHPQSPQEMPATKPENMLLVLSSRRANNARNQLRSVLLEMYEIFGSDFVEDMEAECKAIYLEYCKLTKPVKKSKSVKK